MLLRHIVYFNYFDYETRYPAWHLLEGSLWTMTVLLVLLAPLRTKSLLSNRILRTLGRLSYSIYLVHVPVLMLGLAAVRARWPNLITGWTVAGGVVFTLLCAICLTISTVTYLVIERPMLQAKARLRRWSVPRSSAVARDEQIQLPQVVTTLSARRHTLLLTVSPSVARHFLGRQLSTQRGFVLRRSLEQGIHEATLASIIPVNVLSVVI
jgi:hypothetical protein